MVDLVQEFFKRDLSVAEQESLSKLLEGSPEAALSYENLLEQNYLATGLPQPTLPQGLHSLPRIGGGGPMVWSGAAKILLAVLALGGAVLWKFWSAGKAEISMAAPPPSVQQTIDNPLTEPVNHGLKKPVRVEPQASGPVQEGQELSVVVNAPKKSLVTVRILDQAGKEIRVLYTGFVEAGRWNFQWDGLLGNGEAADAGEYRIDVQTGAAHQAKDIRVKLGPPSP